MKTWMLSIGIAALLQSLWVAEARPSEPFSTAEKSAALGVGSAALIVAWTTAGPEEKPRLTWNFPGDRAVSNWLGTSTAEGSRTQARLSNWTHWPVVLAPVFLTGQNVGTTRWQAVESYGATGLVVASAKALVGRERPYVAQCRDNPLGQDCFSSYRFESFISGHSAFAFTGAGLLCSFRTDAFCPVGIGLAGLTGIFRITSNQHFLSDVIAGALIGWMSGFYLPKWRGRHGGSQTSESTPTYGYQFAFAIR